MREILNFDPAVDGYVSRHRTRPLHPTHRHDDLEFVLVTLGTATFVVGEQRYDLVPGSLVWLFPGQEHQLIDQSRDLACWILVVRPRALAAFRRDPQYRMLLEANPPGHWLRRPGTADRLLLDGLLIDLHRGGARPARLNPGLRYALCAAWDAFHRAPTQAEHPVHPGVSAACAALGRDPSVSLARVAQDAALSLSRLEHLFRAQLGTTLTSYRNRRRIERFQALALAHPERTTLSHALAAGFGSYPQFHRVFRHLHGIAPATWLRAQVTASD